MTGPVHVGCLRSSRVAAASAAGRDLLLGVLGAEALAGDLDEVRPVGQPIEGGRGEQGLAEELRPFRPVAIRGQENRAPFIPLVDDVVEVLGPGRAERV